MTMEETLTVLVIDDSSDDRMLYRRVLREAFGDRLRFLEEGSGESGLAVIAKGEPRCVLLDYSLPGRNGIEVLKRIRVAHKHLPVILLTGQGNEFVAVQAMKEGAQDYITKTAITAESLSHVILMAIENGDLQKRVDEQRAALEIFSQALAHDLREPVRSVCSFAEMICNGEIEGDVRDEYMRHIRDAGERMALLIDTVTSYTQIDGSVEPERETFGLQEAVTAAMANLSALFRERGTAVTVEKLPEVTANRTQIIQVLQNLMANSVSHSPEPVRIGVAAMHGREAVRVCISDNGPGIAFEHQERIFEPFRRLNRDNAHCGLGLAICRKIVEGHGGTIGCESEIGAGASFFFELPGAAAVAEEKSTAEEPAVATPAPPNGTMVANLLVVDDRDDDILFTRTFLTGPLGMHCNFLVAHDGKAGLEAIRERLGEDPVDLILLDINMPVMNGFEMLKVMSDDTTLRLIPVVMCSGSRRDKDMELARNLGAVGYLAKPVRFEHLQPIIAKASGLRLTEGGAGQPILMRDG
jgi:signal transduction histidine kinase